MHRFSSLLCPTVLALSFLALTPASSHAQSFSYYDVDLSEHLHIERLASGTDWRPTSISVWGPIHALRYAVIWKLDPGTEWTTDFDLNLASLAFTVQARQAQGFRLATLSVTGDVPNERYTAIFLKDGIPSQGYVRLSSSELEDRLEQARGTGFWPEWLSSSPSSSGEPMYTMLLVKNPGSSAWSVHQDLTAAEYQEVFDATTLAWARPHLTAMRSEGSGLRYSVIFRDDVIGPYATYHALTKSQYSTLNQHMNRYGAVPIRLEGARLSSGETRLTAMFALSEVPVERELHVTGLTIPELESFDSWIVQRMKASGTRAATLAIAKDGRLKATRGYTWAEPGYPITQSTDVTRIASCSKVLASLALHLQYQQAKTSPAANLMSAIGMSPSDAHPDWSAVKVQQLITHTAGSTWNPNDVEISAYHWEPLPVNRDHAIAYRMSEPLNYVPGTKKVYSNFGYALVSRVVDQVNPGSFNNVMQQQIYDRLELTRPRPARTLLSQKYADELRYHDWRLDVRPSDMSPDQPLLPVQYGSNIEREDASKGILVAAPDMVKVLAGISHGRQPLLNSTWREHFFSMLTVDGESISNGGMTMKGLDHRVVSYSKGGSATVTSVIIHRTDDIDIAVFFNGKGVPSTSVNSLNDLADQVNDWQGAVDYFPSVGIPSF
ncbi:MAG: serine hydrolase [Planctomycetota bacterium]